jgi:anaerobic selenocysteine-containing dehydrogenase
MPQSPADQGGVATHCPYCAFQCGVQLSGARERIVVAGNEAFPVNKGRLCIKGWTAGSVLGHPERLLTPWIRNARGVHQCRRGQQPKPRGRGKRKKARRWVVERTHGWIQ